MSALKVGIYLIKNECKADRLHNSGKLQRSGKFYIFCVYRDGNKNQCIPRLVGQKHSAYVVCRHVKHTFHGSSLPCKGKSMFQSSRHSTFVHYLAACVHKMSQYWNF